MRTGTVGVAAAAGAEALAPFPGRFFHESCLPINVFCRVYIYILKFVSRFVYLWHVQKTYTYIDIYSDRILSYIIFYTHEKSIMHMRLAAPTETLLSDPQPYQSCTGPRLGQQRSLLLSQLTWLKPTGLAQDWAQTLQRMQCVMFMPRQKLRTLVTNLNIQIYPK